MKWYQNRDIESNHEKHEREIIRTMKDKENLIQVDGSELVVDGKPIRLRGIGLGNWLLIEDFMIGLPGVQWQMETMFRYIIDDEVGREFFRKFREVYITEEDIKYIAECGFNMVRVPFNYRLFESDLAPFEYREEGFRHLDNVIKWCTKYGIYVLLDLHAAAGGQNTTPPSDNVTGYALLYTVKHFQDRFVALWEEIARRYKDEPFVFGYDLVNEPITIHMAETSPDEQFQCLMDLYHRTIKAITAIDPDHCFIIEGKVRPAGGIATLDRTLFDYPNTVASFHFYSTNNNGLLQKSDMAEREDGTKPVDRGLMEKEMEREHKFVQEINCPMLLGEFGMYSDKDTENQTALFETQLDVVEEWGWHWSVWHYKDIGVMGLLGANPDTSWRKFVDREDIKKVCEEAHRYRADTTNHYIEVFKKDDETSLYYDQGWNDVTHGVERMELVYQLKKLNEYPKDEILQMPESFSIDNCSVFENMLSVLKKYLPKSS